MKKVIVVSKTHLDLGFTDYASVVKDKYIHEFIPNAISVARNVNKEKSNFVWTTGSWIIREALRHGTDEEIASLTKALKDGDIAPHAIPFTLHTELLDEDTFDYGLTIVDELDSIRGRKTISAKMTDVPGHTKAMIPLLQKHGIKLLHIGVNGASALADVPPCFLWKNGDSEIVVIYSGEYGGEYKNENVDDILYFDHTLDNHGGRGSEAVLENIAGIGESHPEYEVIGGTIDDYADQIWEERHKLPVITSEIGDSWIHGAATDPYKAMMIRKLIECKNRWIADGTLNRDSAEYDGICNNILCLAEHTCGMDCKLHEGINDYYLAEDFLPVQRKGKFSAIEKSWAEQREYIASAMDAMSEAHRKEFDEIITECTKIDDDDTADIDSAKIGEKAEIGNFSIAINEFGGIKSLSLNGNPFIEGNENPLLTIRSYGAKDYDRWHRTYNRCIEETKHWSLQDFGRPNLDKVYDIFGEDKHYFATGVRKEDNTIYVDLECDQDTVADLGAPDLATISYTATGNDLKIRLAWYNKRASRLTQSISLNLPLSDGNIRYKKLGSYINPLDVVYNGNRKLSAVQSVATNDTEIISHSNPLVTIGKVNIMDWNNEYGNTTDGISFVLYDNVWGTNFPLWYESKCDKFDFTYKFND